LSRVKTFDSTGLATAGRLYAGDLNQIQDQYADLSNLAQAISTGSLAVGELGLQLVRYGAGEARISGALRIDGILRCLSGLYAGGFTTAQRDAIPPMSRPYGLVILNTTSNRLEINLGSGASPAWSGLSSAIVRGVLGARTAPSATNANSFYFATDDQGGTLYYSDGAVWTKISRGLTEPITAAMIPANSVDDSKVAVGALSANRIAGTAVITSDGRLSDQRTPLDNSVTTSKIMDAAVTSAKLASDVLTSIQQAAAAPVACVVRRAAALTLPYGHIYTTIPFDTEDWDPFDCHSGSNDYVTIPQTGLYQLNYMVRGTGAPNWCRVLLNGSVELGWVGGHLGTNNAIVAQSFLYPLTAGWTLQLQAFNDADTNSYPLILAADAPVLSFVKVA
jgi:hypothetical protein